MSHQHFVEIPYSSASSHLLTKWGFRITGNRIKVIFPSAQTFFCFKLEVSRTEYAKKIRKTKQYPYSVCFTTQELNGTLKLWIWTSDALSMVHCAHLTHVNFASLRKQTWKYFKDTSQTCHQEFEKHLIPSLMIWAGQGSTEEAPSSLAAWPRCSRIPMKLPGFPEKESFSFLTW